MGVVQLEEEKKSAMPRMMDAGKSAPQIEVRREDQDRINEFGRLVNKKGFLNERITRADDAKKKNEDAQEEVMMLDDSDKCLYLVGESFVEMTSEEANERVEKEMEALDLQLTEDKTKLAEVEDRLSELKKALYARFGDSIQLEENK